MHSISRRLRPFLLALAILLMIAPPAGITARGEEAADNGTLTIAFLDPVVTYDDNFPEFQEQNPQFRLNFVDSLSDKEYKERVAQGDDTFDFAVLIDSTSNLQALIHHGKAAPLPDEELLADVMDMGWGVENRILNEQGVLCAYPITLGAGCRTVRMDLIAQSGLGKIAETADEYLDQMIRWYTDSAFADARAAYRFSHYNEPADMAYIAFIDLVDAYRHAFTHCGLMPEGQALCFNTPAFRASLEKIRVLYELDDSLLDCDPQKPIIYSSTISPFWVDEEETFLYDLPYLPGEKPTAHMLPMVLVLNPNSPNRSTALSFLRQYSAQRSDEKYFELHPFMSYTGTDEKVIAHEQDYRDAAAHICLDCNPLRMPLFVQKENAWTLVCRYFEGQATAEEVLTQLDAHLAAWMEANR